MAANSIGSEAQELVLFNFQSGPESRAEGGRIVVMGVCGATRADYNWGISGTEPN